MNPADANEFYGVIKDGGVAGVLLLVSMALIFYILRQEKKIENRDELTRVLNGLKQSIDDMKNAIFQMRKSNEDLQTAYEKSNMEMRILHKEILASQYAVTQKSLEAISDKTDKLLEYCIKKG